MEYITGLPIFRSLYNNEFIGTALVEDAMRLFTVYDQSLWIGWPQCNFLRIKVKNIFYFTFVSKIENHKGKQKSKITKVKNICKGKKIGREPKTIKNGLSPEGRQSFLPL